jgi:hypothetical protein
LRLFGELRLFQDPREENTSHDDPFLMRSPARSCGSAAGSRSTRTSISAAPSATRTYMPSGDVRSRAPTRHRILAPAGRSRSA